MPFPPTPTPMTSTDVSPQLRASQLVHEHESRGATVLAVQVVLTAMATIATLARVMARRMSKAPLRADDYTLGAALASVHNGLGRHEYVVNRAALEDFSQGEYAFNVLYPACIMLVKISILLLYRALFVTRPFRITVLVVGGYVILLGIASVLVAIFKCKGVRDGWKTAGSGQCIDELTFFVATAALNLVADVVVLILPMPVVWRLQMLRKQKLALTAIFALGGCACGFAAIRLVLLAQLIPSRNATDVTWFLVDPANWSTIEPCVGIICACLPTIAPLFRAAGGRRRPSHWHPRLPTIIRSPPDHHPAALVQTSIHAEPDSTTSAAPSPAAALPVLPPDRDEMSAGLGAAVIIHVRSDVQWASAQSQRLWRVGV
ncbi:MAG: hypothetical protein M1826_005745 [Phylliscum demangeonii]|nr:MAG: hypothetical protein M1826_005745 [Phylliscum demangeonii]